jgi:hypothetical protein
MGRGTDTAVSNHSAMATTVHDEADLELALLRRGVVEIARECERCEHCHRSPLIGERVYVYASGATICELCRTVERAQPVHSHTVHGPEFGHTLRIIDRRSDASEAA